MATLPNVPAPKNSGLSLLADTAAEQSGTYHYPVKRRGLPRALLPNWDAIRWLEADKRDTEIEYQEGPDQEGLVYTFAYGRTEKSYPRPMFQVIHDETFSSFRGITATACPCGDFSRTAYCDEHGELEYDWNRRAWVRPGTEIWYQHHPEDRPAVVEPDPPTAYYDTGQRPPNAPPGGLYDRMIEMFGQQLPATWDDEVQRERRRQAASLTGRWITADQVAQFGTSQCTCSRCRIRYVGDPNDGRPGFHYNALTDRWERDTADALGDFRAGAPVRTPETNPENRALTSDRVPDTIQVDVSGFTHVPDELMGPTRQEWLDRVLGLQSATIRIEGVFGEGVITFETEEDAGGDTSTT